MSWFTVRIKWDVNFWVSWLSCATFVTKKYHYSIGVHMVLLGAFFFNSYYFSFFSFNVPIQYINILLWNSKTNNPNNNMAIVLKSRSPLHGKFTSTHPLKRKEKSIGSFRERGPRKKQKISKSKSSHLQSCEKDMVVWLFSYWTPWLWFCFLFSHNKIKLLDCQQSHSLKNHDQFNIYYAWNLILVIWNISKITLVQNLILALGIRFEIWCW